MESVEISPNKEASTSGSSGVGSLESVKESEDGSVSVNACGTSANVSRNCSEGKFKEQDRIYIIEDGFFVLTKRMKNDIKTVKEMIIFLKKRMAVEEEYVKLSSKVNKHCVDVLDKDHDLKQGSFKIGWQTLLDTTDNMISNRQSFVLSTSESVIENLNSLVKDMEKNRKAVKEEGNKHRKILSESMERLAKAKSKYHHLAHEWEKAILEKHKMENNPKQRKASVVNKLIKSEEDAKEKAALAEKHYEMQLADSNAVQNDFYSVHLPMVLRTGMNFREEADEMFQKLFLDFAILMSSTAVKDANLLRSTEYEKGVSDAIKSVDLTGDFKQFVVDASLKSSIIANEMILFEDYEMSKDAAFILNPNPVFGVALDTQTSSQNVENVPDFLHRCCEVIEKQMNVEGIYKIPGISSVVSDLRRCVDRDPKGCDFSKFDVHAVAVLVRQFFDELPEPLMTYKLFESWMGVDCGSCSGEENSEVKQSCDQLRDIAKHLPKENQSTLKYICGHLNKVASHSLYNKMNAKGLSVLFGPVFLTCPEKESNSSNVNRKQTIVETLISQYSVIFESVTPPSRSNSSTLKSFAEDFDESEGKRTNLSESLKVTIPSTSEPTAGDYEAPLSPKELQAEQHNPEANVPTSTIEGTAMENETEP
eukprot:Nk52_evm37s2192 gene=Nk52_evmTU37s2192